MFNEDLKTILKKKKNQRSPENRKKLSKEK